MLQAYHVELTLSWEAEGIHPTSKKNRHLVLDSASQEGEPRSEILLNPPSFKL